MNPTERFQFLIYVFAFWLLLAVAYGEYLYFHKCTVVEQHYVRLVEIKP